MLFATRTAERRAVQIGTATFATLALSKLLILVMFGAPASAWTPAAFFWQDAAVAIALAVVALAVRLKALIWLIYGLLVIYVAINVPIAVVLGSPLTRTMMQAMGGALSDSIWHHVTLTNIARLATVLVGGAYAPVVVGRMSRRATAVTGAAALLLVAVGPFAADRIATAGMDRNAITVLLPRSSSVRTARTSVGWRASPVVIDGSRLGARGSKEQDLRSGQATLGLPELSRYRTAARGWNVILVVLESTAAQYLAQYGATSDPMPAFTALSRDAIVFEHAYAVYPESVKGLYATLCGRMPMFRTPAEQHATLPCAAVADAFKQQGYRTGLFHSGRFRYLGMDALVERLGFETREDAGAIGGNVESSFGVDETATVARLLSWVDHGPPDTPFFTAYLPIAGHHPYAVTSPGPFEEDSELGRYRNALHEADAALAQLIAGLRERRLDRRTALVIVGDHGEAFGQHRGNSGHTLFIYDENVHVPYVIALPGATTGQTRVATSASLLDTGATLRDLVGLATAPEDEGTSLLTPGARMAPFFTDYSLGWLGLGDGCWKYLFEVDTDRSHLYDVCSDPSEQKDLVETAPTRVSRYRAWWGQVLN